MDSMILYLLLIVLMIVSWVIQSRFRSKAKKYSEEGLANGMSGAEIARKMLKDNSIYDVEVIHTQGELTDNYDPTKKTVNLSDSVYHGRSILAAAVAAHECGHALQHAKAYSWLEFRSMMVGPVTIASRYMSMLLLGGILLAAFSQIYFVLLLGVILFSLTTLFSFVTLPVEFDASNRAMAWLTTNGMVVGGEGGKAKDALNWAAKTYVINALASLATLLYYVSIFLGRDD